MPRRKSELAKEQAGTLRGLRDLPVLPLPEIQAIVAAISLRIEVSKLAAAQLTGRKQEKALDHIRVLTDDLTVALERLASSTAAASNKRVYRPGLLDMTGDQVNAADPELTEHERLAWGFSYIGGFLGFGLTPGTQAEQNAAMKA